MNKCALETVKNHIFVQKESSKNDFIDAVINNKEKSFIEIYKDTYRLYKTLFEYLEKERWE